MAEVVITGMGMVTSLGTTASETAAAWRAGGTAVRRPLPELAGSVLENAPAAVLPEFDPAQRLGGRRMLKYMSDAAVMGCVAAHEACADADIKNRFRPERVGLYAATGLAAAGVKDVVPLIHESTGPDGRFSCRLLGERGLPATNPLLSFKILANMPPCLVSIQESIKGPNCIFTPWESQAAAALVEAWQAVAEGEVDCAIAGAADSPAHPATFIFLRQAGLLAEDEYPADGAAYLVFERAETAHRDTRHIHAHVAGLRLCRDVPVARLSVPVARLSVPAARLRRPTGAPPETEFRRPTGASLPARMGRSFAAAPAIMLALACLVPQGEVSMRCTDRAVRGEAWEFRAELGSAA